MRVLVFGHSDTDGSMLADRAESLPRIIESELPELLGEPVEVTFRRIFPNRPAAALYVDRVLAEDEPQYVILALGSAAFALRTVALRLRHLGSRPQRWCDAVSRHSERHARRLGPPGVAAYTVVQRGVRKIVGTETLYTPESTIEAYRAIFLRLAREEKTEVAIVGGSHYHSRHYRLDREFPFRIIGVKEIVRQVALDHYFTWVDWEAVICAAGDPDEYYLPDGVHRSAAGHRVLADALLPLMAESGRTTPTPNR